MNKSQIVHILESHTHELKAFGVERIGIFGSFVRGEENEQSDIDMLVAIKKERKTLVNYIKFCDFVESLFQGRKVDIVSENGLSPFIGPHIKREVEYVNL